MAKRFVTAMNKSLAYAQSHPDDVRKIVGSYTKIKPAVAEKMKLPYWSDSLNRPSIEFTAAQAQKLGYTKRKVDTRELIWSGAPAG